MDHSVGSARVLADERNAVDKELTSLRRDSENFTVEGLKCGAVLENSTELETRNNVVGHDAFQQFVV